MKGGDETDSAVDKLAAFLDQNAGIKFVRIGLSLERQLIGGQRAKGDLPLPNYFQIGVKHLDRYRAFEIRDYTSFAPFNSSAMSLMPTPGPLGTDILPDFTLIGGSNKFAYFSKPILYS